MRIKGITKYSLCTVWNLRMRVVIKGTCSYVCWMILTRHYKLTMRQTRASSIFGISAPQHMTASYIYYDEFGDQDCVTLYEKCGQCDSKEEEDDD
jgi:hypothetical protein